MSKIYLHAEYSDRSGIDIDYNAKYKTISIGGWYDGGVGIENHNLSLWDFFTRLGITEKDCLSAFRKDSK